MTSAIHRIVAVLGLMLILDPRAVVAQQASGRWITDKLAPLPQPSEEYTNVVSNGKLYLIGGNSAVLTPGAKAVHPARVMEYDLANDKWTQKKSVPFFADHMTAAAYRDKIYMLGGWGALGDGDPTTTLKNAWEYDPVADSWK